MHRVPRPLARAIRPAFRGLLIALLVPLVAAGCAAGESPEAPIAAYGQPSLADHEVGVGGGSRSYLLHLPPRPPRRLGRDQPIPLVVVLHGSGADGETVRAQSGMDAEGDARRFAVAYPNGSTGWLGRLQSDWNAGDGCCGWAAAHDVDDVAFIRALVDDVGRRVPLDRRRVYVAGFSDGATMTSRLGCEMAGEIAALAVVSGAPPGGACRPTRPLPVILFHGTEDGEVAYGDAPAPLDDTVGQPPSRAARFWAAVDSCASSVSSQVAPHVRREAWRSCRGGEVELLAVVGGRHAWPGGAPDGAHGAEPTREISATARIASFFARFQLPAGAAPGTRLRRAGQRTATRFD